MSTSAKRSVGTKTVLFSDIVDSTRVRTRIGDRAADVLVREIQRIHETAIHGNGGAIVKSLGDGFMATFDGAEPGLVAATEIQALIRDRNRQTEHEVGLRVGLSTGDVSIESDGDYQGTPVVEAARLCGAAQAGQILIADVVRVLAGNRGTQDLIELGPQEYKGLAFPLVTWEVRWDAATPPEVKLPAALSFNADFSFVGRTTERHRLDAAWERAMNGQLAMVLLAGEPGAGKTRLTAEFASAAVARGATLLFGCCEDGLGVPHQPFVESIRHLLSTGPQPRLGSHPADLARLVPEIVDHVADLPPPISSDPETERYQLFNAYVDLLRDVADEAPVVLVLDDLHWATRPTLQLLRHVIRAKLEAPVLVLGTYRDTEIDEDHPFAEALADMHRSDTVERIQLGGLDLTNVRSYLGELAGYELDHRADALAARIHAETDGNPFFVREVLLHLVEAEHLYLQDGKWETKEGFLDAVPAGARDVISQRLSRLGDNTRTLLARAAVIGVDFPLDLLGHIVPQGEHEIFDCLERAASARLVEEIGINRWRFSHALVRSALIDGLSASRVALLHREIAEAIETRSASTDDVVEDLAAHWIAAGDAATRGKALEFTVRAARRAGAQLAHDAAAALLASGLELLRAADGSDRAVAELLTELGGAQQRAGDPAARTTLLEAGRLAHRIGAADLLIASVLLNARVAAVLDVDEERVELLEMALAAIESPAGSDVSASNRCRVFANLGFELSFTHDRVRVFELSDAALALARSSGDLADVAFVLSMRVIAFRSPDTLNERLAVCAEIESISAQLDDPAMEFLAAFRRAEVVMDAGDTPAFRSVVATMVAISDRLGQPMMAWNTARRRAELALLDGDLGEAERLSIEMRKLGSELQLPFAEPIYVALMSKILNTLGRSDQSTELWAQWVDRIHLIGFRFGLARALLLAGRPEQAFEHWEIGAMNDFEDIQRDLSWMETIGLAADVACDLGDERRSAIIADALLPHRNHIITSGVGALCPSDHALGVAALGAGDLELAIEALTGAIVAGQAAQAPLLVAHSQIRLAQAHARRGNQHEANALLDTASSTSRRHHANGLIDMITGIRTGEEHQ